MQVESEEEGQFVSVHGEQKSYDFLQDEELTSNINEDTINENISNQGEGVGNPPSAIYCSDNSPVSDKIYIHPNKGTGEGVTSNTNSDSHKILLLREVLNCLLEKNASCLTDDEVKRLKRHIWLCNKAAHPGNDVSRHDLISIYDMLILHQPWNYNESDKNFIIGVFDRCKGNFRDIHVSKFKNSLSQDEFLQAYCDTFQRFGTIEKIKFCAREVHIRFTDPEVVDKILEEHEVKITYFDRGAVQHQIVSVKKASIDKDYTCQYLDPKMSQSRQEREYGSQSARPKSVKRKSGQQRAHGKRGPQAQGLSRSVGTSTFRKGPPWHRGLDPLENNIQRPVMGHESWEKTFIPEITKDFLPNYCKI